MVRQAVTVYGEDNFIKSFLGYSFSHHELSALEEKLIAFEKDVLGRGEYNIARLVNSPNVASSVGAEKASQQSKVKSEKRYVDFLSRYSNQELIEAFHAYPTAAALAESLREPIGNVERWMRDNSISSSTKHLTKPKDDESRSSSVKISDSMKRSWTDPEVRARIIASQTGRKRSEEHRANISKALSAVSRDKQCLYCSKQFTAKKARVQFCSRACGALARHRGLPDR